ncbi:MAG: hypothetical protein FD187_677 [bacterium]|nr:MAG: hypothetical protein FD142_934 [bacterium]KAF0150087.1 MAG: hypothetical protein FD187_677 [bacterium]KAF0169195.1 MAG: hypothetical protein FD158_747 [bacterium]
MFSFLRSPPLALLPPAPARALRSIPGLLGLAVLALVLGEPMRAHSDALVTSAAPLGILSLQFACGAGAVQTILASWDAFMLEHARLSLYWDMAFAPAYGLALAALGERLGGGLRRGAHGGHVTAWLPLLAAAADLLENVLHLLLIAGGALVVALPACAAALLKWALLAAWLASVLAGLFGRRR